MTDNCKTVADAHLRRAAARGCEESRLLISRRAMLGVTAGLFSWAYMPRFAEAAGSTDPRLLVVLLRGGMDGLNVVVPFGDPHYVSMRGSIAIPAASTIHLNSFFGLHPALRNFGAMYNSGDAAVVHAACVPMRNRSHFDCQANLENGLPPALVPIHSGWLNRLLSILPAGAPLRTQGAIQINDTPAILLGDEPVLGWSPSPFPAVEDPTLYLLRTLYRSNDRQMYDTLELGLKANDLAASVDQDDGDISILRKGFRGAGRLLASPEGPRIAVLSVGGWDTHVKQGGADGELADVLTELDAGIGDFKTTAGSAWKDTVMVLVTEFGRTVRVNGDDGTDHGVGTVALLAGGAVNGGRVHCDWPGLSAAALYEGSDLNPTTDLRAVFKGVLMDHIGVTRTLLNKTIFPESSKVAPMRDLLKTPTAARTASAAKQNDGDGPFQMENAVARYRRKYPTSHGT